MSDQNYLKPRLCLHYSAYYRVFNIFSPFVSLAIHIIKTLVLLLVVLCEKSNGEATARPSKGRPRRTEAVKRLNFCSQPSCCGIRVRRLLDLRRVRRNIAATSKLGCDSRRDSPWSRRKQRKQWLNSLDYVYVA